MPDISDINLQSLAEKAINRVPINQWRPEEIQLFVWAFYPLKSRLDEISACLTDDDWAVVAMSQATFDTIGIVRPKIIADIYVSIGPAPDHVQDAARALRTLLITPHDIAA